MSTLPLLLSLAEELDNLASLPSYSDDFGFGIYPHQLTRYYRPALRLQLPHAHRLAAAERQRDLQKSDKAATTVGKDGFQVCMDVQQFKPSELTVKTVDNCIVVEGKHEEREDDHGFISRHFVRRYALPKGYDPNQVVSTLSSDGVLTVKVPPPAKSLESNERVIQIQQTGPAHLSVKENPKEEEKTEEKKE
uniref:Putative 23kda heat shock protein schsp23 n=1 Tax=Tabanus bromius TaxID=304241 RepID=A0A0K8TNL1_TABBR